MELESEVSRSVVWVTQVQQGKYGLNYKRNSDYGICHSTHRYQIHHQHSLVLKTNNLLITMPAGAVSATRSVAILVPISSANNDNNKTQGKWVPAHPSVEETHVIN